MFFDTGTEPQSAYVVPSAKTARRETIRLGLLPSRDPNVPRTANIIKPKDHSIWKVSKVVTLPEPEPEPESEPFLTYTDQPNPNPNPNPNPHLSPFTLTC